VNGSVACSGITSSGGATVSTDITVGDHVYTAKIGNGMTNMRFNTNGNVGIGVNNTSGYLLQVNGACAGTSWTNLSDIRKKDVISDKVLELSQIANAPMFAFRWKDQSIDTRIHIGTSAQYWEKIAPEIVSQDGIGFLGMQYDVAALLAAVTTAKKVEDHERRIAALEAENERLKKEIEELKAA
jgi:hypothetical protein